ncbi:hypothetical protein [Photobacterium sp. R1]
MITSVKPRIPFNHLYAWINSLFFDHGHSIDEIVEILTKDQGSQTSPPKTQEEVEQEKSEFKLIVNHCLGKVSDDEIRHLCPPTEPKSLEYLKPVREGHLCIAKGASSGDFSVLIQLERMSEEDMKSLIDKHNETLTFLAYKKAHEGYPYGIAGQNEPAKCGINRKDLFNFDLI